LFKIIIKDVIRIKIDINIVRSLLDKRGPIWTGMACMNCGTYTIVRDDSLVKFQHAFEKYRDPRYFLNEKVKCCSKPRYLYAIVKSDGMFSSGVTSDVVPGEYFSATDYMQDVIVPICLMPEDYPWSQVI
jgi:hypothetical protein